MFSEKVDLRKALYIALSILAAAGIWLFVDLTSNNGNPQTKERTITDIPIEYINESSLTERGLMLVDEGTDQTLDLKLAGTRWRVSCLDRSDIRVTVDLSNIERAGVQNVGYSVNYTDRRFLNNAIWRTDASIYNATVNIKELYSRSVEVRCELVGNVAEGFSAGQVQLSHNMLNIEGRAEDIDHVSYARVVFDIGADAEESVRQDLEVQFFDEAGNELDSAGIRPETETIQAVLPVFVTKELRLRMDFSSAPGARERNLVYTINPETITVSGDAGTLKDLETITLDTLDLLALRENSSGTYFYPITVPEGCQNLSGVTRATLKIAFRDMATASVATSQFRWENLPGNRTVDILTAEVPVEIFGTAESVAAVNGEALTVVMDLSDYGAALGTYSVPVIIENASGQDVGISGSYEVQITIREVAPSVPDPDVTQPDIPQPENQPAE